MRILQVSTADEAGGAEASARNLFNGYREVGHESWLAVRSKHGSDPNVVVIPNEAYRNPWARFCNKIATSDSFVSGNIPGLGRLIPLLQGLGKPDHWIRKQRGIEEFDFPGTEHLLNMAAGRPDIIHCHNLHGDYFDLRELPALSRQVPVVLNLRDAWLLSGHCAYSFSCNKWETGCGQCPDLSLFPDVKRDNTAYNWRRKKDIFEKSRLYVTTPSRWLMDRVKKSIVGPAIIEGRVIPNGVDLSLFKPGDRTKARRDLGIPQDSNVLLFAAHRVKDNVWKDYNTFRAAIARLAESCPDREVTIIALGEQDPPETVGKVLIRFIPFQKNREDLVRYYQASDVYVHAARVESFGNTVLEARACGLPVVATAVGGIPEQVKGLRRGANDDANLFGAEEATGILVQEADAADMASAIATLLNDEDLRRRLGQNARADVQARFDLKLQIHAFVSWYEEILAQWNRTNAASAS